MGIKEDFVNGSIEQVDLAVIRDEKFDMIYGFQFNNKAKSVLEHIANNKKLVYPDVVLDIANINRNYNLEREILHNLVNLNKSSSVMLRSAIMLNDLESVKSLIEKDSELINKEILIRNFSELCLVKIDSKHFEHYEAILTPLKVALISGVKYEENKIQDKVNDDIVKYLLDNGAELNRDKFLMLGKLECLKGKDGRETLKEKYIEYDIDDLASVYNSKKTQNLIEERLKVKDIMIKKSVNYNLYSRIKRKEYFSKFDNRKDYKSVKSQKRSFSSIKY